MNETLTTVVLAGAVLVFSVVAYLRSERLREEKARLAVEKGKVHSDGPKAQHPQIDISRCIGCRSCAMVCPEGDVLAVISGKSTIVNGYKCVGHGLCAEACPLGAIKMVMAAPGLSADLPFLSPEGETSVPNLFIAGELGGLALIKNAVNQGRDCIDTIAARLAGAASQSSDPATFDVLIVGAGPAGISASLRAIQRKLHYLTIEREGIGGTVAKFPRQKLVMTSPVEFPLYGKFQKTQISKENLLAFWRKVFQRADLKVQVGEHVVDVQQEPGGVFTVTTQKDGQAGQYRARAVVLGLGRAGTPRKLGIPGEHLPKVMYRLIEADHYVDQRILVVGGGDSAIEAAMGLARQHGNHVTLSYRQEAFRRIKERNAVRIEECMRKGSIQVWFGSSPVEIRQELVVLDVRGENRELPNDYVFVFAGGTPPNDFLRKIGVAFGTRDVTSEVSLAARPAPEALPIGPRALATEY